MTPQQEKEQHAVLADAAAVAERHNYALGMAAAVKSLTSVEKPSAAELADLKAAEAEWKTASKALAEYEARHL
jgi:hypothetical protein